MTGKFIDEINSLIPVLTCSDLEKVRGELKGWMQSAVVSGRKAAE